MNKNKETVNLAVYKKINEIVKPSTPLLKKINNFLSLTTLNTPNQTSRLFASPRAYNNPSYRASNVDDLYTKLAE